VREREGKREREGGREERNGKGWEKGGKMPGGKGGEQEGRGGMEKRRKEKAENSAKPTPSWGSWLAATATPSPRFSELAPLFRRTRESPRPRRRPPYLVIARPFVFWNTNEGVRGGAARGETDRRRYFVGGRRAEYGMHIDYIGAGEISRMYLERDYR